MKIKTSYYKYITIVYVVTEILLYGSFLYIDIFNNTAYVLSSYLKFTGIVLCFLYTLVLSGLGPNKIDIRILRLALFFTLISDLLILMVNIYLAGMVSFSVVQSLYLIRLGLWEGKRKNLPSNKLIIKKMGRNIFITLFIYLCLNLAYIKVDILLGITCFYFVGILCNVKDAVVIAYKYRMKNQILYAFGMVLFLLCDINVGVFNLSGYISIHGSWYSTLYLFASVAMWLFYLPSQLLISLSGQVMDSEKLQNQ